MGWKCSYCSFGTGLNWRLAILWWWFYFIRFPVKQCGPSFYLKRSSLIVPRTVCLGLIWLQTRTLDPPLCIKGSCEQGSLARAVTQFAGLVLRDKAGGFTPLQLSTFCLHLKQQHSLSQFQCRVWNFGKAKILSFESTLLCSKHLTVSKGVELWSALIVTRDSAPNERNWIGTRSETFFCVPWLQLGSRTGLMCGRLSGCEQLQTDWLRSASWSHFLSKWASWFLMRRPHPRLFRTVQEEKLQPMTWQIPFVSPTLRLSAKYQNWKSFQQQSLNSQSCVRDRRPTSQTSYLLNICRCDRHDVQFVAVHLQVIFSNTETKTRLEISLLLFCTRALAYRLQMLQERFQDLSTNDVQVSSTNHYANEEKAAKTLLDSGVWVYSRKLRHSDCGKNCANLVVSCGMKTSLIRKEGTFKADRSSRWSLIPVLIGSADQYSCSYIYTIHDAQTETANPRKAHL